MSPPVPSTVYCCIAEAEGNRVIMHSYNSGGQELEALAAECLNSAPAFHTWYFHTAGTRTFGFLMMEGYTYFAVVEPSSGHLAVLQFLESIRDAFKKAPKNGLQDEVVSAIKCLVECRPQPPLLISENCEGNGGLPSAKEPLLRNGRHSDRKQMKEIVSEDDDGVLAVNEDGMVKVDVPSEPALRRSLNSNGVPVPQLVGRELWRRHVKIIIAVDVILCLVLFGVWLGVCKGLHCVSK